MDVSGGSSCSYLINFELSDISLLEIGLRRAIIKQLTIYIYFFISEGVDCKAIAAIKKVTAFFEKRLNIYTKMTKHRKPEEKSLDSSVRIGNQVVRVQESKRSNCEFYHCAWCCPSA